MPSQVRTALVTGASSGIGRATALQLASQGYQVYAAARRTEKVKEALVVGIEPLYLDVNSEESIQQAIDTIMQATGRIDVLVNNAGYGLYGTIEEVSLGDAREQFEVNVFGLMSLTKRVLPIMRQQRSGHIVNVSSIVGKFALPTGGWYAASKHALEALSDALRLEMKPFGVKVVVVEPGVIKTEFSEVSQQKSKGTKELESYRSLRSGFRKMSESRQQSAADPYVVAQVIGDAVMSQNPRPRYAVPGGAKVMLALKGLLGDRIYDWIMGRQLNWR